MKTENVMEREEIETTPMEPLSPMSHMLSSPNFFIVITFGFKVRCNPSAFVEGINNSLINAPRFSSKMVTYIMYSTRMHAYCYIKNMVYVFYKKKNMVYVIYLHVVSKNLYSFLSLFMYVVTCNLVLNYAYGSYFFFFFFFLS